MAPSDWLPLLDNLSPALRESFTDDPTIQDSFLSYIDESDYSLADWVAALQTFDAWLAEKNIEARPASSMLGYLHCCQMVSPDVLAPPRLSSVLKSNLNDFGFEAEQGCEV